MEDKFFKKRIEKILTSNKDKLYKKSAIVAVITEVMKKTGIKPIVVGGQAVEFYTSGGYSTMDIDLICELSIAEIDSILKLLGFKKEGKYWILEESDDIVI